MDEKQEQKVVEIETSLSSWGECVRFAFWIVACKTWDCIKARYDKAKTWLLNSIG